LETTYEQQCCWLEQIFKSARKHLGMNGGLTLERKQSNVKIAFQNILSTLERSRTYGYTRSTSFNWRIHLREGGAPQRRFFFNQGQ
jgi:hypothetical protein